MWQSTWSTYLSDVLCSVCDYAAAAVSLQLRALLDDTHGQQYAWLHRWLQAFVALPHLCTPSQHAPSHLRSCNGRLPLCLADQDSVRLLAVESCGAFAAALSKDDCSASLLPVVQKFAQVSQPPCHLILQGHALQTAVRHDSAGLLFGVQLWAFDFDALSRCCIQQSPTACPS
jgi:hypothetical protein